MPKGNFLLMVNKNESIKKYSFRSTMCLVLCSVLGKCQWIYHETSVIKNKASLMAQMGLWPTFNPCVRKIPWRRDRLPTPFFLSGEFNEERRACRATVHGSQRVGHNWVIKLSNDETSVIKNLMQIFYKTELKPEPMWFDYFTK